MNFLKKTLAFVLGAAAAVGLGFGVAALAQVSNVPGAGSSLYSGLNLATNQNGVIGIPVAMGTVPTLSGAGCGTLATVQASQIGGTSLTQFAANATTCTITLTLPAVNGVITAAPHGLFCVAVDETHVATAASQTAHTTTSCTVSLTGVTSADLILVELNAF
jgi:hypothetical protein